MNADFLTTQDDSRPLLEPRRPQLAPSERVIVTLLILGLAASCWVTSAPGGVPDEAGARPWRAGSVLRSVTQLMSLNFEYPTQRGYEIKWLAQGLTGVALLSAGVIAWFAAAKRAAGELPAGGEPVQAWTFRRRAALLFSSMTPTNSAQMAFLLFAGWTFLSAWWAPWPAGALGEAFRQFVPIVLAVVLGRTLRPRGVRAAAVLVVAVTALTSILSLWYYYERNPVQRLKFPIGNPIFLGAVLLPGLILPLTLLGSMVMGAVFRRRSAAQLDVASAPSARIHPGWLVAAAAGALFIGWALALTGGRWLYFLYGSRGPVLGFFVGLVAVAYAAMPRRFRWVLLLIVGLCAALMVSNIVGGLYADASRGSTVRVRLYAWRIALERFVVRPVTGLGQGGYSLSAQRGALDDFVNDPAAFPIAAIDHAHNEWLEILCDLGAAGFALVSTALGLTFWAAGLALKRMTDRADRVCLLGLVGALAALIAEEATSLGLHKPVIPLLFFTIIGLIWAMARSTETHPWRETAPAPGSVSRTAGLVAGLASAGVAAWLVIGDWHGARAAYRAAELIERKDWMGALNQFALAQRNRLGIDDRIMDARAECSVASAAAGFWLTELESLARQMPDPSQLPPSAREVARENAARFDQFSERCFQVGSGLLGRIPFFPGVAGILADALFMRAQKEEMEAHLGLRPEARSYHDPIREWRAYEYQCNRLDAAGGVRLLEFTPASVPLRERLELLRVPLRSGPVYGPAQVYLGVLMQDPEFGPVMTEWMKAAEVVAGHPTVEWADPYAPETLRMAGLCEEIIRQRAMEGVSAAQAAERIGEIVERLRSQAIPQARQAADLLMPRRPWFPAAAAFARADQARFELFADPSQPDAALATYRQALSEWMAGGPQEYERILRLDLATFLLAAGRFEEAAAHLKLLVPTANPRAVEGQLVGRLQRLCEWFIDSPPEMRPAGFLPAVDRLVELASTSPVAQWMAAQVDIERGLHDRAFGRIDTIATLDNRQFLDTAIRLLLTRFPDDASLHGFIQERTTQSQPADDETPPASTQPATGFAP